MVSLLRFFQTNYDCLIENSFGNRAIIIREDLDIPSLQGKTTKPIILKIHGDIHALDKLIITKDDYANALNQGTISNYLKHIIATKDIVFIGYSYEDNNIWSLFNEVNSYLKGKERKKIIINPNLKSYDKSNFERKGFICFDLCAQDFIQKLDLNINENILNDVQNKKTSIDVFYEYLDYRNLSADYKNQKDQIIINNIKNQKGEIEEKISFTLDQELAEKLIEFNKGKSDSTEFKLSNKDLISFEGRSHGLKWPLTQNMISELIVVKLPVEKNIEIENIDKDLCFNNIKAKLLNSENRFNIEFKIGGCRIYLTINAKGDKYELFHKFEIDDYLSETTENIKVFELLLGSAIGEKTYINVDNNLRLNISVPKKQRSQENINDIKWYLDTLKKLRKIELSKDIRFRRISFNEFKKFENTINYAYDIIYSGIVRINSFDYAVKFDGKGANPINRKIVNHFGFQKNSFVAVTKTMPSYKIFDKEIQLGYSVIEIINPMRTLNNDEELIHSKDGKIIFRHIDSIDKLI